MTVLILGVAAVALAGCAGPPPCRVDESATDALRANGSCLIVVERRVLAIRHRASGKYDLPGGRRLPDETAQCAAHRETFEETGLEVTVGRRLSTFAGAALYQCVPRQPVPENPAAPFSSVLEVAGLAWVDPAEIEPEAWRFENTSRTVGAVLSP